MSDENKLENLEFFESFMDSDPLEDVASDDPNANVAPDILQGEEFDPLKDTEEAAEDTSESKEELPEVPTETATETPTEEIEEETEETTDEVEEGDEEESDNPFEVFAKGLIEAGMLDMDEEGEKVEWSEETFISTMEETIDNRMWGRLEELASETYGEAGVKLVEDIFINKVPIPEYLQMFNNEQAVDSVDLSDEGNQERVFRLYLAKTGMDEDEIEDQLAYARDNDRLEAYANKYKGKLVEKLETERAQLAQEAEARVAELRKKEEEREESYAKALEESITAGEIEGYPINNNDAEELFSFVLDKPHILPNGQRISDFEYRLATMRQEDPKKFLAVARLVQKDLDLTPIKKKAVSEETNTIFKGLKTKTKTSGKSTKKQEDLFAKYFK
jgi:hypothetical protein